VARQRVTDQALPDGVYPYTIGSGDKQQQRYYAKLASGATKRSFKTAIAAARYKNAEDSGPPKRKQTGETSKALWPEYLRARRPYLVPGAYVSGANSSSSSRSASQSWISDFVTAATLSSPKRGISRSLPWRS